MRITASNGDSTLVFGITQQVKQHGKTHRRVTKPVNMVRQPNEETQRKASGTTMDTRTLIPKGREVIVLIRKLKPANGTGCRDNLQSFVVVLNKHEDGKVLKQQDVIAIEPKRLTVGVDDKPADFRTKPHDKVVVFIVVYADEMRRMVNVVDVKLRV